MARPRSSLALAIPPRSAAIRGANMARRHGRAFGRRAPIYDTAVALPQPAVSDDLKQLVTTFLGGLVFVAVLIA